jgi:hypothetical protein
LRSRIGLVGSGEVVVGNASRAFRSLGWICGGVGSSGDDGCAFPRIGEVLLSVFDSELSFRGEEEAGSAGTDFASVSKGVCGGVVAFVETCWSDEPRLPGLLPDEAEDVARIG